MKIEESKEQRLKRKYRYENLSDDMIVGIGIVILIAVLAFAISANILVWQGDSIALKVLISALDLIILLFLLSRYFQNKADEL